MSRTMETHMGVIGRRDSLSLFILHWHLGGTLFSYCDNYITE